jgi:hypothetical protein
MKIIRACLIAALLLLAARAMVTETQSTYTQTDRYVISVVSDGGT